MFGFAFTAALFFELDGRRGRALTDASHKQTSGAAGAVNTRHPTRVHPSGLTQRSTGNFGSHCTARVPAGFSLSIWFCCFLLPVPSGKIWKLRPRLPSSSRCIAAASLLNPYPQRIRSGCHASCLRTLRASLRGSLIFVSLGLVTDARSST